MQFGHLVRASKELGVPPVTADDGAGAGAGAGVGDGVGAGEGDGVDDSGPTTKLPLTQ